MHAVKINIYMNNIKNGRFVKLTIEDRREWKKIVKNKKIKKDIMTKINNIWQKNKLLSCEVIFLAHLAYHDLKHINARFNRYRKSKNRRANNLYNYLLKYGKKDAIKKYKDKNKKCAHTKDNYINKYGIEEGLKKYNLHCKRKRNTKSRFIERYGHDVGLKKYKNYCTKNKGNLTLSRKIHLYGKIEGIKKYNEQQYMFMFNNTLQGFIKRYGPKEGIKKYETRLDKMLNGQSNSGVSRKSQHLFNILYNEFLKDRFNIDDIFYHDLNKEIKIKGYSIDFLLKPLNKIIEFNGDRFHANPEKFNENDYPHPYFKNKTAKEIWQFDEIRLNILRQEGYEVFIVWEQEFRKNREDTLNNCLEFLLK
jgi:very-short-patch-repair endonuclease